MITKVKASAKNVRVSPQKVRQVARNIVGLPALEAVVVLDFHEKAAALPGAGDGVRDLRFGRGPLR